MWSCQRGDKRQDDVVEQKPKVMKISRKSWLRTSSMLEQ